MSSSPRKDKDKEKGKEKERDKEKEKEKEKEVAASALRLLGEPVGNVLLVLPSLSLVSHVADRALLYPVRFKCEHLRGRVGRPALCGARVARRECGAALRAPLPLARALTRHGR